MYIYTPLHTQETLSVLLKHQLLSFLPFTRCTLCMFILYDIQRTLYRGQLPNAKPPFLNGPALSQTGISSPGGLIIHHSLPLPPNGDSSTYNHESRHEEKCLGSLADASSPLPASTTMAGDKNNANESDSDLERGFGATRCDDGDSSAHRQHANCGSVVWYVVCCVVFMRV